MKASKLQNFLSLFPNSGYKSPWLSYPTIYLLAILMPLVHILIFPFILPNGDTFTYFLAAQNYAHGHLDDFRTPGYPIFINAVKLLINKLFCIKGDISISIVIIQFILFIASIPLFQKVAERVINSRRIVFWIVAFYSLSLGLGKYYHTIIPECITICLSVALLLFTIPNVGQKVNIKQTIYALITIGILILLKPVFIYLIPVILLYYISLYFSHKLQNIKVLYTALIGVFLLGGSMAFYAYKIHQRIGVHSISVVNVYNNYFLLREFSHPDSKYAKGEKAKATIDLIKKERPQTLHADESVWIEMDSISRCMDMSEFEQFVSQSLKDNPTKVINVYIQRLFRDDTALPILGNLKECLKEEKCDRLLTNIASKISLRLMPSLLQCVVFCIVFFIISLRFWVKIRRIPYIALYLFLISFGIIATSILGAYGGYSRLCISATPALLLMIGMTLNLFSRNKEIFS